MLEEENESKSTPNTNGRKNSDFALDIVLQEEVCTVLGAHTCKNKILLYLLINRLTREWIGLQLLLSQ